MRSASARENRPRWKANSRTSGISRQPVSRPSQAHCRCYGTSRMPLSRSGDGGCDRPEQGDHEAHQGRQGAVDRSLADHTGQYILTIVEKAAMAQEIVANADAFADGLKTTATSPWKGFTLRPAKPSSNPNQQRQSPRWRSS